MTFKDGKDYRHRTWLTQKLQNEKLARGCLGITIKVNQSIELSNGISIVLRKVDGQQAGLLIVAPKDIRIVREVPAE